MADGTIEDGHHDDEALRARAGHAIRHLGHALVGHHADPALLVELVETVEGLAARLDAHDIRTRPGTDMQNRLLEGVVADGEVIVSYPDRPISGAASPWGVELVVTREGDEAVGRCTLRAAHEGAPQRSHGGVVAAIFDDLYGFVLSLQQEMAFTGDLYVRYEAPTPLHTELTFRSRVVRRDGRKLFLESEARHGEQRFASSRATFIIVGTYVPEG